MFSLQEFIKKGLLDAVGKMADYQIILNAAGWYDKSVLLEEDLAEINAAIEQQYVVQPEPEQEEPGIPEELPEPEIEVPASEQGIQTENTESTEQQLNN